jgi:hypothetical protein
MYILMAGGSVRVRQGVQKDSFLYQKDIYILVIETNQTWNLRSRSVINNESRIEENKKQQNTGIGTNVS